MRNKKPAFLSTGFYNFKKEKNCSFIVVILAMASVIFSVAANQVSGRLGFFGPFAAPLGVFYFLGKNIKIPELKDEGKLVKRSMEKSIF